MANKKIKEVVKSVVSGFRREVLDPGEDNGTMLSNVNDLESAIIGHRIIDATEKGEALTLTLDSGKKVRLSNTHDCCAYTALRSFFLDPASVDHIVIGIKTSDEYQTWRILADFGQIMEMSVGWSAGNPFYYTYGFDIEVLNE